ncbi:endonuclease/exonuclease/phosphatase family protein [Roseovarius atlanticus]|uniref:endonuclease/exonuclease/phosphatase family protein n=1 Tax=Roseovarius atlanticus TaxID=1641875 RepID=UPI001C9805C1|nr:endonuclease/exonuclease/phosphatase family protein [Roseovarius atlanticus]MBY5989435.1 endonuclease/exonuclease/phosphatase family protein [Roseovarius atlanticus]MBY6124827.1 endonuclease/exonuclease/phosphatase family protein [Roseovarius atlanticus]MBY6149322.1 endonuclease/exonuclease/phosphatase family protein [Roseovarius atlanticus]
MTDVTIASFNVKNLIDPDREYYEFQSYTPEEYAWKLDWMADQILTLDADVICFQEIFEKDALHAVIDEASIRARALNDASIPDRSKRYHRKAIFRKLAVTPYDNATLAFAPNAADTGEPGKRRPGVAILSRLGFTGTPEIIQDLEEPLSIPFQPLRGMDGTQDAGHYVLRRLSRPVIKARIPMGGQTVTVFNCHLKSKLGEYITPPGADYAPEEDLTHYDPIGRAMGSLRATVRRMAEAWVLRREVVREIEAGHPVMVLGDFNDGEHAVSTEIITGEAPFKNYAWMLRHDAQDRSDRYSDEENRRITENVERVRLHSAEKMFVRKSLRDMVYTSAFGGVFESIDQIFLSRHFHPDNPDRAGEMTYFSVFNDHLTDGSHPEAPYNKLASDHGQIMAHLRMQKT